MESEIVSVLKQSAIITLFVLAMMLIIEYLNVFTKGLWSKGLEKSAWKQVLLGTLLGIIPGCLGAYTAVSMYVHHIFRTGALVSTMIATSGDEAFLMFSIIPEKALLLNLILFIIAVAVGLIVDYFYKGKPRIPLEGKHFHLHEVPECTCFEKQSILKQLVNMTATRALMLFVIITAFVLVFIGGGDEHGALQQVMSIGEKAAEHHHGHPQWVQATFLVVLLFSVFVVVTVNDHFLEKHLWGHIVRKHFLKVFLWTFGTLLFVAVLNRFYDLNGLVGQNLFVVLIIAVLVGIIPESGPHMIFVLLFANGTLPFSILLASSIVQDGHGSLPLLAESRKAFVLVKGLNILAGLMIGGAGLLLGV